MKKNTADQLAAYVLGIWTQSKVVHARALGENGYYVLATQEARPIDDFHRLDCTEWSDEASALELMGPAQP